MFSDPLIHVIFFPAPPGRGLNQKELMQNDTNAPYDVSEKLIRNIIDGTST